MSVANDTTPANPLLTAALSYAARGWPVFPLHSLLPEGRCDCRKSECESPAKHPRTRDGLKSATTDEKQIRKWWSMWPSSGVGVKTGEIAPGRFLSVLDIDPRAGGDDSLESLERANAPLPDTLLVLTGGGGRHFYFEGASPLKTTSARLGPGLDTRGGGGGFGDGYVVAPPSRHVSGRNYERELSSPDSPAEPPSWLLQLANGPASTPRPSNGAGEAAADRILDGQAGGAGRKKTLHSIGRTMRARGLNAEEIFVSLAAINAGRCEPPLDEKDVRRVAENAAKVAPGRSPEYENRAAPREPGEDDDTPSTPDWTAGLAKEKSGKLKSTFANTCAVLRASPTYAERFSFNEMSLSPMCDGQPLSDGDVGRLREQIEKLYGFSPEVGNLRLALLTVGEERRFHPVRAYLSGLPKWDGRERIAEIPSAVFGVGARDLALSRTLLRAWFISAVARARRPGCKVDTALVLVGEQGLRKSTFFQTLAGAFFSDTHVDLSNKDAYLQIHEAWVYEWGEIEQITSQRHAGQVKAFVTSASDTFRPPFGAAVKKVAREGVIVGSTNEERFLTDATGSRRFWVVRVNRAIDAEWLKTERDQLWAEAVAAFEQGESWWLSLEDEKTREKAAEAHYVGDAWEQPIADFLFRSPSSAHTSFALLRGVLDLQPAQMDQRALNRVGKVMRRLGYEHRRRREGGDLVWEWFKPSTSNDPEE